MHSTGFTQLDANLIIHLIPDNVWPQFNCGTWTSSWYQDPLEGTSCCFRISEEVGASLLTQSVQLLYYYHNNISLKRTQARHTTPFISSWEIYENFIDWNRCSNLKIYTGRKVGRRDSIVQD